MLFRLSIGGSSCYRIFQDLTGQLAKRSISSSSSLAPEKDSKGSEGGEPQEKFAKGDWQVVVCTNGALAFWHPEKPFPFEHTRSIDLGAVEKERKAFFDRFKNSPATKVKEIPQKEEKEDEKGRRLAPYGAEGPQNIDLREIFYTEPHEWRSRYREKRLYSCIAPVERRRRRH